VIEDAPAGVQAAHAAGSRVIGVTTTFSAAELDEAELVVPSLASLRLASTANDTTDTPLLTHMRKCCYHTPGSGNNSHSRPGTRLKSSALEVSYNYH
jgi:hypothetical protein